MNKTSVAQQAKTTSFLPTVQGILQRQCACGNHTIAGVECTECAKKKSGLQRKLTIGASNDPLEQEADQIVAQVMTTPLNSAVNATPIQRFTRQANEGVNTAPSRVDHVISNAGRPLEPTLREDMEHRFSQDFSRVHFHPSSPEVTSPLQARAVTIRQDIYFHPGQFCPDTLWGENLIAHELAHTLQTRQSPVLCDSLQKTVSQPSDTLEQNADALALGNTSQVLAAPAGSVLRSPFDSEPVADRERRLLLIEAIDNAMQNLLRLLRTGGIVKGSEVVVERAGVHGVVVPAESAGTSDEMFFSYSDRDVMIRRIIRSLIAMSSLYRRAPILSSLPAATPDENDSFSTQITVQGGTSSYGGSSAIWSQLQAAYELYRISQGQTGDAYSFDWYYLKPNLQITPGSARGAPRIGRGIPTGAYMVVPDIDNDPLNYWHLDGFRQIPRDAVIVEFWNDDFGYYYMHNDQRIDVPSPWR